MQIEALGRAVAAHMGAVRKVAASPASESQLLSGIPESTVSCRTFAGP